MTTERAPAKINVCLFLGPTREHDGRHELVSVMQAADLCDDLVLAPATGPHDEVVCPGVDGENLALAAVAAFRSRTGWDGPPVRIEIAKRIPVAAGMAGGSADAGAALRLIAREAGVHDDGLLRQIAATLGADVPAQVRPGRHLATGAGEVVAALAAPAPYGVLVLPSDAALSTPAVFREADRLGLPRDADSLTERAAAVRAALDAGDGELPDELVVNELQPAALSLCPSIADALADATAAGARHALVSGSGPTVLGLFADPQAAHEAARALAGRRPAHAAQPLAAAQEPAA